MCTYGGKNVIGVGIGNGMNQGRVDAVLLNVLWETSRTGKFRQDRSWMRDNDHAYVFGCQQTGQDWYQANSYALFLNLYVNQHISPSDRYIGCAKITLS